MPPVPFSELLSRGSRVLEREVTGDLISLAQRRAGWGTDSQRQAVLDSARASVHVLGLKLCRCTGKHLHAPFSSSLLDPLPAWAGPGFVAGGRGRDLQGSSSLSDEGTPAGETG